MNIIVTGATGFIGASLLNQLLLEGHTVYCFVRPESKNINKLPLHRNCHIINIKLSDSEDFVNQNSEKIEAIYHLAWEGIRASDRDNEQMQYDNYLNSLAVMRLAIKLQVKKFIGIGSQAEYGIKQEITDDTKKDPLSAYGRYKLITSHELRELAEIGHINFYWSRVFSVYGPGDYENTLIMKCISSVLRNEDIELTQAIQVWDYLYIDDLVSAFMRFLDCDPKPGEYNIASGYSKPLRDFVEIIKSQANSRSKLLFGAIPYADTGIVNLVVDVSNTKRELDWSPKTAFEVGIGKLIKESKTG